jgi:peptidoglycan biosynthesis protein MviN/MurJ (putative lipid II flippase)
MGAFGLGYAQSIVAVIEVVMLLGIMNYRIRGLVDRKIMNAFGRMFIATVITSIVCYAMVVLFQLQGDDASILATLPKFFLISTVSLLTYLFASRFFNLHEAEPILRKLQSLLFSRTR